jgi:uracil-DNA glycosylase
MPESVEKPHPFSYEIAKLVAQLVVITLGGAAITFVFQYLGEQRDERAQQAAFERQTFLNLQQGRPAHCRPCHRDGSCQG